MDELQRFLFQGLAVRGQLVRLNESWREMLARRGSAPHAAPVRDLLGQMAAAGVLLQSSIEFDGTLLLQVYGDGPVKLAVAEVHDDLRFRATATVLGEVAAGAGLQSLLNLHGQGRCSITLDPSGRRAGQQPYQGVVPLGGDGPEPPQQLAQVLEHYMLKSQQIETRLLLAADQDTAAGLMIQRMPAAGPSRVSGEGHDIGHDDGFNRITHLMATLTRDELLRLDAATLLHRLFWQERLLRHEPRRPRFACSCARERVRNMLRGLGPDEVRGIIAERGEVEVGCEFCGQQYRFDAVDVGELFTPPRDQPHTPASLQ
ncbi:MAG TPA: Hsp33 family molecular chaperone HslO [Rubrivivax sp.]|nr:Hsp33 family molecular chaperone HslO [Rubrivivax sp.]